MHQSHVNVYFLQVAYNDAGALWFLKALKQSFVCIDFMQDYSSILKLIHDADNASIRKWEPL